MGVVTEVVAASAMGGCSHGGHVTNLHKRQPKRLDFIRNGEERHNLHGYHVLLSVTYTFLVSESEG